MKKIIEIVIDLIIGVSAGMATFFYLSNKRAKDEMKGLEKDG